MARSASRIEYRCSFRQPLYEQIQEPDVFGIRISSSLSCVTCRDLVVAFSHDLLSGGVVVHTLHHRCSTRLIESVSVSGFRVGSPMMQGSGGCLVAAGSQIPPRKGQLQDLLRRGPV